MTGHLQGWLVNYGSSRVMESNALWHGYDSSVYRDHCGVAAMSPANLGQTVWIRPLSPDRNKPLPWYGPCGVFDVSARTDFYHLVYEVRGASSVGEILEVPRDILSQWGITYGSIGEAYFGDCPPPPDSQPGQYLPPVEIDNRRPVVSYSAWPYPPQQIVVSCDADDPRTDERHK